MNKEVEELLNKLGSMEDAPLIWINQRVLNLITENEQLKEKVNQLETNRDEAIEYIQKHFEEEYKKPREELKKYNLKNCTYDSGLVVLGILERGK